MDDKLVKKEHKRLTDILISAEVPKPTQDALVPVIDNLSWLRVKLDDFREQFKNADIVCKYNNGGGQKGIRINPFFKGYNDLCRTYLNYLDKYLSCLPKEVQEEEKQESEGILSIISKVRGA